MLARWPLCLLFSLWVLFCSQYCSQHCAKCAGFGNLREFVKTHVILAPVREFSRSRAASKIPFPSAEAGKAGQPGEFQICHFRCKNRYVRARMI